MAGMGKKKATRCAGVNARKAGAPDARRSDELGARRSGVPGARKAGAHMSGGPNARTSGGPNARKVGARGGAQASAKRKIGERNAQTSDARRARLSSGAQAASLPKCELCDVFGRCGGCSLLDVAYDKQLADKQRFVENLFAGLADTSAFLPIKGMENPFHYRNKVISPYAPGRKIASGRDKGAAASRRGSAPRREVLTGMYAKGTHKLVPADACALENETAKRVTLVVRDLMLKWNIAPYDEDAGAGFMRHAVVRVGHASGEVLVTLVTNDDAFPSSKSFCRELKRRVPEVTTVVQSVNTRQTNVILGEQEHVLYGPGFILDTLCGLSFRISSHSFYQVNVTQTEVLYNTAVELAGLRGAETVIDAYCGTGTIGLVAASRGAGRVIGVDNVESAIRDARENARHNGIDNAEFVALDAGAFMQKFAVQRALAGVDGAGADVGAGASTSAGARAGAQTPAAPPSADDLVLMMDPPRAGSTERFLDAAARLAPSRIVYISCNPATQARDVAHLTQHGYRVEAVQPVDMFPHTDHVECVCSLVREDVCHVEQ